MSSESIPARKNPPSPDAVAITWQWLGFDELSVDELYKLLRARVDVFVVEQTCPYPELDGLDSIAEHLIGWDENAEQPTIAAYLRLIPPRRDQLLPALGRILTAREYRSAGLGRPLVETGLVRCQERFEGKDVYISAQAHLQAFYGSLGFVRVSEVYDDDGIAHIDMHFTANE